MGLEAGTYVDDLVSTNPSSGDPRSQGDDHLRLIKALLRATFPRAGKPFPFYTYLAKTADYTIQSTDEHTFFGADGTSAAVGLTLPTLASGDKGWYCIVRAVNLTSAVTLVGTVNGVATYTFSIVGQTVVVWWSGTAWFAYSDKIVDIVNMTALTAPAKDDSLAIYDLSATANRKIALSDLFKAINALTAETAPAVDDVLALYDLSATDSRSMTVADFLKVLNALTEDTAPDLGADFILSYDTSASGVKKVKPNALEAFGSRLFQATAEFASGTAGGTATAGSWLTRPLNTAPVNEITGATLASNQISLPAGTYFVDAWANFNDTSSSAVKMRDITGGADLVVGSPAAQTNSFHAHVRGRFTLAGTSTIELQYRVSNGVATNGLGNPATFGVSEVYANVCIWRLK